MPSTVEQSIALRLDEIERRMRRELPEAYLCDVGWLVNTLRREMAKTETLRSSLARVCKKVEEVHASLKGVRARRERAPLAPLLEAKRPPV